VCSVVSVCLCLCPRDEMKTYRSTHWRAGGTQFIQHTHTHTRTHTYIQHTHRAHITPTIHTIHRQHIHKVHTLTQHTHNTHTHAHPQHTNIAHAQRTRTRTHTHTRSTHAHNTTHIHVHGVKRTYLGAPAKTCEHQARVKARTHRQKKNTKN